MKNFLLLILIFTCFNINTVLAQKTDGDSDKVEMVCEEKEKEFPFDLDPKVTYPKSDYTFGEAVIDLQEQLAKAFVKCNENCLPEGFDCFPVGRFTSTPEADSTYLKYRFSGEGVLMATCGECTRVKKTDAQGTEVPPGEGRNITQDQIKLSATAPKSNMHATAQLEKVYPNPTADYFQVDIKLEKDADEVQLLVHDFSGALVYAKDYGEVDASLLRVKGEVDQLQSGFYVVSVIVDGQAVGSSQLSIQK